MISIIDYQAGNLSSVKRALQEIGYNPIITSDPEQILHSDKVIFPGVGAAGQAMDSLILLGIDQALKEYIQKGQALLGICLGAQIILDSSVENNTKCLGLIKGKVKLLKASGDLKVPHMGWNQVKQTKSSPLFKNIPDNTNFYFVHSYYPDVASENILGTTDYGIVFPSIINQDNIFAVQFHTEKSGIWGLKLLKNFLEMNI